MIRLDLLFYLQIFVGNHKSLSKKSNPSPNKNHQQVLNNPTLRPKKSNEKLRLDGLLRVAHQHHVEMRCCCDSTLFGHRCSSEAKAPLPRWLTCFTRSFLCSNNIPHTRLHVAWIYMMLTTVTYGNNRFHFHWWDFLGGGNRICSIISIESKQILHVCCVFKLVFSRVYLPKKVKFGLSDSWVHCCFVSVAFEKGSHLPLEWAR